jgi:UDP-N-acetyl-D-glucosamine dehydrogenase
VVILGVACKKDIDDLRESSSLNIIDLLQQGGFHCVVIATDHSDNDYATIVNQAQLVIDTRNATCGFDSPKILRP